MANAKLRRPESEYARQRRQHDTSPRYRQENIINLDLDLPERTTQEYEGPGMVSRVDMLLGMPINEDDGEELTFNNEVSGLANPYLQYEPGGVANAPGNGSTGEKTKSKSKKNSKPSSESNGASGSGSGSSSRPKSASRRREGEDGATYRSSQAYGKTPIDEEYSGRGARK
jgi:hypothetical protein